MKFIYKRYLLIIILLLTAQVNASSIDHFKKAGIQKVAASFKGLCQSKQYSGTVLITMHGKIRFQGACGLASRGFSASNTISTKFNLGSIGKLFTIVSIAQLIEENKLSLNTQVKKVIPSWLPMKMGNQITVGQLLIHASGLGNFMQDKRWQLGADSGLYNTTNAYQPLVSDEKLLFKPGTSQSYSNSGYIILGKLIEKISGLSYKEYIQKNIFNPAGMHNTGIWPLDDIVKNRAVGYYYSCQKRNCKWKNNYFQAPYIGTSAGGAYSTVGDLFKFSQFLYHHQLLNKNFTKKILSTTVSRPSKKLIVKDYKIGDANIPETMRPYGFAGAWNTLGFAVWKNPVLLGHTGGTPGAGALLAMSPDNKYVIIILSNNGAKGQVALYQKIRDDLKFSKTIRNI